MLHSMRLVAPTRIPRNIQLSDLAVRRGCGPEGLSCAGCRSPLRVPAGGPEITPSPYHASFPTVCVWQLLLAYRGNENSLFPGKPRRSMRLVPPARIPREQKRPFPRNSLHSMRLVSRARIPREQKRPSPKEIAPQYASRTLCTHTVALPTVRAGRERTAY